jgi:2-polyprenyl-6-methoxyphenol hydroxylase-like FAD-dependent oxidoreductase
VPEAGVERQLTISTPPVEASLRGLLNSYGVTVELGRESGDVEVEGLDRSHGRAWMTDDQQLVALTPLPATSKWQFQATVHAGRDGGFPEPSLELFQQLTDQRCPVPNLRLSNATWVSLYRDRQGMVDRHQVGRAFVAGDAAHIHSPAGGLGANTGIQDG